jgi:hypothetical protein
MGVYRGGNAAQFAALLQVCYEFSEVFVTHSFPIV